VVSRPEGRDPVRGGAGGAAEAQGAAGEGRLDRSAVLEALQGVPDPEIPVVSVVDLGIVQDVVIAGRRVEVAITPTFTGCPALEVMREGIREAVLALGAEAVDVRIVLDPPWSSDRITPQARERMRSIGIAPPGPAPAARFASDPLLALTSATAAEDEEPVACPFCGSLDTALEGAFGPTICRSLHYCRSCQQPFESFKAL
jgi:ring-1,2-phenylacetyl-CoA epoxidase subunit PaaD